jgi:acetone carboxylase gamma subunit
MTNAVEITEYLAIDLADERWRCCRCDHDLGSARRNYKEGCAVADRDPHEIHEAVVDGEYTFAPDPEWCRIVEFYVQTAPPCWKWNICRPAIRSRTTSSSISMHSRPSTAGERRAT